MEDAKINYDYTVRNASGSIIQFLYGEDGMDAAKLENQSLTHYIESDFEKLKKEYLLTKEDDLKYYLDDETLTKFQNTPDWEETFKAHFHQVIKDREYIIKEMFDNRKETSLLYPISFQRIIHNAKVTFKDKGMSDLSPMEALKTLEQLGEELYISKTNRGNKLLNILIRCYLSPKKIVMEYKFSKSTFEYVIQQVKLKFYDAIAHPSEMVGVIAAQSIGEPSTQMSCVKDTRIKILGTNNTSYNGPIGDFIDKLITKHQDSVKQIGHDSVVLDLDEDYKIIGVSNDEKTSWMKISQVSRHPANGGLVKVTTLSGKTTTATLSHSFLKRTEKGIEPILGSELRIGQRIPIAKSVPIIENGLSDINIPGIGDIRLNREFGWLCGAYLADGSTTYGSVSIAKIIPEYVAKVKSVVKTLFGLDVRYQQEEISRGFGYPTGSSIFNSIYLVEFFTKNFGKLSSNKFVPAWVFASNKEFMSGLLSGYFDGDGNVSKNSVRNGSVSENLTADIIVMLSYFDIFASKALETTKNKPFHTLHIPRKYAKKFSDYIGFIVNEKQEALEKLVANYKPEDDNRDIIDKIPNVGNLVNAVGSALNLPGQSRNYGRWTKKESIGRQTLIKYIQRFEEANQIQNMKDVAEKITLLKQAAFSDVIWDEITELEYLDDPNEFVYDFTVPGNDSFMVDAGVLVHNTLNSVEWNTPMLFSVDNKLQKIEMGKFIDEYISKLDAKQIEDHPNDTTLGWTKDMDIKVLSSDTKGQITWQKVEALTRHPPINKDGTNTLLKVTTKSGREVTATKAKSFLKRVNNEIIQVNGDDIRVGDYLPISKVLPIAKHIDCYDGIQLTNELGEIIGKHMSQDQTELCEQKIAKLLEAEFKEDLPGWVLQGPTEFTTALLNSLLIKQHKSNHLNESIQQLLIATHINTETTKGGKFSLIQNDVIPDIQTQQFGTLSIHRDKIADYIQKANNPEDKAILQRVLAEDIIYDQIISIDEVTSEYAYVYDLTVENTRNFNIYNGLAMADTFHLSGVSSASKAVRGVPRIKELLSVTRNIKTPALTIYLQDEYSQDKKKARDVMNTIQTTYFADIVKTSKIYYDPNDFDTTIKEDKLFLATYKEFIDQSLIDVKNLSPWLLRLDFDKDKMLEYNIQMIDVYNALEEFYDDHISAMFSDDNAKELIFRIKIHEPDEKHEDIITDLKALEKNIMENLIVKGVKKISKVIMNKQEFFAYDDDSMSFNKMFEWVLETSGTNLIDMFAHRAVDHSRTISNDINEIYETLGIEAARQALFNEISDVIKFADLYVNYRHLSLLVDTMTNKGYMLSIDRHGINRVDIGPLAKSSFEETNDMIVKAGIFAEMDKINGVSANIMLGQIPPAGTGDTDILIDEANLPNKFVPEKQLVEPEDAEAVCDNLCIDYSMPSTSTAAPKKMKEQKLKFV